MPLRTSLLLLILTASVPAAVNGQTPLFGSRDDPAEMVQRAWWQQERFMDVQGGLSLIGAQWRSAARLVAQTEGAAGGIRLDVSARAGVFGAYQQDFNEPYDVLRALAFARMEPKPDRAVYVRAGPLRRTRLGNGQLVDFLRSDSDWDERRIGTEVQIETPSSVLSAFTDDVLLSRLVGVHLEMTPLPRLPRAWRTLAISAGYVADLASRTNPYFEPVAAYQLGLRVRAVHSGAFGFWPFLSVADFTNYGRGLFLGADIEADPFLDIARIHFRVALHYSGDTFIPGYFGAFYPVHNVAARILPTAEGQEGFVGVPLHGAAGGNDLVTEFRLHFLGRFELWYAFKRHYGYQALSEYHLRLFLNSNNFRFEFGQDRGDLGGFFSLLNTESDMALLTFRLEYRVLGPFWLRTEAWYGFDRQESGPDFRTYLPERRFEPYMGLRIEL